MDSLDTAPAPNPAPPALTPAQIASVRAIVREEVKRALDRQRFEAKHIHNSNSDLL